MSNMKLFIIDNNKNPKTMKMRNLIKSIAIVALLAMGMTQAFGQNELGLPANFKQHGTNSSDVVTVLENTDSVTVGSTLKYYVQPDATIAGTLSTFSWTITPALGSQTAGSPTNIADVTFAGTPATGTIVVQETSPSGCAGSTTTINVEAIAAPDVTAITIPAPGCPTGTDGSYTVAGPTATLTISSSVKGFKGVSVNWSLTGPAGFTSVLNQTANLGNGTTIDLSGITLTHSGTYTLTINTITDRIATKSGLTAIVDGTDQTFVLNRAPVTGPIYHLPNN